MRRLKLFIHAEARGSGDFFLVGWEASENNLFALRPPVGLEAGVLHPGAFQGKPSPARLPVSWYEVSMLCPCSYLPCPLHPIRTCRCIK